MDFEFNTLIIHFLILSLKPKVSKLLLKLKQPLSLSFMHQLILLN